MLTKGDEEEEKVEELEDEVEEEVEEEQENDNGYILARSSHPSNWTCISSSISSHMCEFIGLGMDVKGTVDFAVHIYISFIPIRILR